MASITTDSCDEQAIDADCNASFVLPNNKNTFQEFEYLLWLALCMLLIASCLANL